MSSYPRGILLSLATACAFGLVACGGATVDDSTETMTSIAPLERATRSAEATTGESTTPQAPAPAPAQPQDQVAREVDEIPGQDVWPRTPQDVNFLGELSDAGLNVEGVEDQLIATADTVCAQETNAFVEATLPAVAGQLIEQGRSDLNPEELSALIEQHAREAYC